MFVFKHYRRKNNDLGTYGNRKIKWRTKIVLFVFYIVIIRFVFHAVYNARDEILTGYDFDTVKYDF